MGDNHLENHGEGMAWIWALKFYIQFAAFIMIVLNIETGEACLHFVSQT